MEACFIKLVVQISGPNYDLEDSKIHPSSEMLKTRVHLANQEKMEEVATLVELGTARKACSNWRNVDFTASGQSRKETVITFRPITFPRSARSRSISPSFARSLRLEQNCASGWVGANSVHFAMMIASKFGNSTPASDPFPSSKECNNALMTALVLSPTRIRCTRLLSAPKISRNPDSLVVSSISLSRLATL